MPDSTASPAPKPDSTTEGFNTATKALTVGQGLITSQQTPKPCPAPKLTNLPNLSRKLPIAMFAPACLPGTETTAGCPADKAFYLIAVPWTEIADPNLSKTTHPNRAWTAPGGNRYWATEIPVTGRDPKVVKILRMLAEQSRTEFQKVYGSGSNKAKKLSAILAEGKWTAKYGVVTVERPPNPDETAADFIRRNGYLLNVAWFANGHRIEHYAGEAWLAKSHISSLELWANYNLAVNAIGYSIRVVYSSEWSQVVGSVVNFVKDAVSWTCGELNSPDVRTGAAVAMAAFPGAAPYGAAYGAALALCGVSLDPPPCIPQTPVPGAAPPTIWEGNAQPVITVPPPKKGIDAVHAGLIAQVRAAAPATPVPGALPPATYAPRYPFGTIAWLDLGAGGYRIAVPMPGPDTTHREVSAGVFKALPPDGIQIVTKTAWEKATLPFFRRGTTKIGMMATGVAAAALATLYASHH